MIPKTVIEKAAEDWFDLVARKHIPIVPGTFTELWIPNEAVPDLAFQAGARWALEEIEKVWKAKKESQPETKERQPMPEILPGYVVTYNKEQWAVTKQDYRGCLEIYRDCQNRQRILGVDPKDVTRIWNDNGILMWSKE